MTNNHIGRPPANFDIDKAIELLKDARRSVASIARELKIHRNTFYNYVNGRRLNCEYISVQLQRKELREDKQYELVQKRIEHEKEREKLRFHKREEPRLKKLKNGIGKEFCAEPENRCRVCDKCGENKKLTSYYFHKWSSCYRRQCIDCYKKKEAVRWREVGRFNRVRVYNKVPPLTEFYPYLLNENVEGFDLISFINSVVPKSLPNDFRADICQAIALAVIQNEIEVKDITTHVQKYVKEQRAFLPNPYMISLDAPMKSSKRDSSSFTLADTLIAPDRDWNYNPTRITTVYKSGLDDDLTVTELAERLNDAWSVNRLQTTRRDALGTQLSKSHIEDNRKRVTNNFGSSSVPMGVHQRRNFKHSIRTDGQYRKQEALDCAVIDYLEQRVAEETSRQ